MFVQAHIYLSVSFSLKCSEFSITKYLLGATTSFSYTEGECCNYFLILCVDGMVVRQARRYEVLCNCF